MGHPWRSMSRRARRTPAAAGATPGSRWKAKSTARRPAGSGNSCSKRTATGPRRCYTCIFLRPAAAWNRGWRWARMLRQRPRVARVARTTVKECGDAQSQSDDACIKIKQSGRVLDADLSTRASLGSSGVRVSDSRCDNPSDRAGHHDRRSFAEIHPTLPATIGKGPAPKRSNGVLSAPTALLPPTSPP